MKTYRDLFPAIHDFAALYRGYVRARRGKRHTAEVLRFERDLEGNLIRLQDDLASGRYQTGAYRRFYVHEPKTRLVAALPFRDRVAQHALVEQLEPIWEPRFISHSYACRPGKGMHQGANQAQRWLREVQSKHGQAYALKADVAKYFPSIDHATLHALIARRVRCRDTLAMCEEILSSWPEGLPIGNLTSQLWANIYLHELDAHVKQDLRVRRYARYMDDFVIISPDKAYLHELRRHLAVWLQERLHLSLNNKTQVFPVAASRGRSLDFLGYRIWATHKRLRKQSVRRMRRRLSVMQRDYAKGAITLPEIRGRIASWIGHAQHADTHQLRRDVLGGAVFVRGEIRHERA